MRRLAAITFAFVFALALASSGATARAQGWATGLLDPGERAVVVEAGWPGVWLDYLRGHSAGFGWGLYLDANYVFEGVTSSPFIGGGKVGVDLRWALARFGGGDLLARFDPGVQAYFGEFGVPDLALAVPVALAWGRPVGRRVRLSFGLSTPIALAPPPFSTLLAVELPVETGVAAELRVARHTSVLVRVRGGPLFVRVTPSGGFRALAFEAEAGISYQR